MSEIGSLGDFEDWQEGHVVDRCCRKKVICGAGIASYTGDAEREFRPLRASLAALGFDAGDFLEATYGAVRVEGEWQPRPYQIQDAQRPIALSALDLSRELEWYCERLAGTRFYLVGYSLGGVLAFEAAALLMSRNLTAWRGRLAGIALLSAPLLGVDFGILARLADALARRPDFYGQAGVDLVARAKGTESTDRLESQAALLRAAGVRLLTIVDRNDAVVQYRDAVLPSAKERGEVLGVDAKLPETADEVARRYGHGPILSDPRALDVVARLIGAQECLGRHKGFAPGGSVEDELRDLRERFRRERGE